MRISRPKIKTSKWFNTNETRGFKWGNLERFRKFSLTAHWSFFSFVGSLSILKALDREEQEVFNLTIVAEDHGIPQLSTSQVLSVQVIDVNDEAPVFQRAEFEAQVMENQGPGTTVLKVTATDRDQGWFKCVISFI